MEYNNYISKKAIKSWLENYNSLVAGDRTLEYIPTNSGPKAIDGITDSYLNKVMLVNAINKLPKNHRYCTIARWVKELPFRETRERLGVSYDKYFNYCIESVNMLYDYLNQK